jgi:Family of unknown function (DUF5337)
MALPPAREDGTARKARTAGLVIAGTAVLWLGAQAVGAQYGWPDRYAILIDLAAVAAFFWALVVTYQIWRKRRNV